MKNQSQNAHSETGVFLCSCGRLIKEDDAPCACGNEVDFTVFEGSYYSSVCRDLFTKGGITAICGLAKPWE